MCSHCALYAKPEACQELFADNVELPQDSKRRKLGSSSVANAASCSSSASRPILPISFFWSFSPAGGVQTFFQVQSEGPLEYGDFTGNFRQQLSDFLGRQDESRHGKGPDPARILLTAGVSQGLDMVSTMCAEKGDVVLVENPTYFLAPAIFKNHGLQVVGVDSDGQGMVVQSLVNVLQQLTLSCRKVAMLYTIPVHHNPTGRSMPEERRKAIVSVAKEHGILIVADEVYTLLTYGTSPPPSMATLGENVLSVGSFSKILAPGLRVGWIEGSPEQLKRLSAWGVIDSGGHLSHFASCVVATTMMSRALDTHLGHLRKVYQERCKCLVDALRDTLPEDCSATSPEGGYFVWVELPMHVDAERLASNPDTFGFVAKPGHLFTTVEDGDNKSNKNCIRLCFARLRNEQLTEGVKRLVAAIKQAKSRNPVENRVLLLTVCNLFCSLETFCGQGQGFDSF